MRPAAPSANPDEVTVQEMKRRHGRRPGLGIKVIDVRDPDEYEISHIQGVPQIPLGDLPLRFTELDPNQQLYIHCRQERQFHEGAGGSSANKASIRQERSKAASTPGPRKLTATSRCIDRVEIQNLPAHIPRSALRIPHWNSRP